MSHVGRTNSPVTAKPSPMTSTPCAPAHPSAKTRPARIGRHKSPTVSRAAERPKAVRQEWRCSAVRHCLSPDKGHGPRGWIACVIPAGSPPCGSNTPLSQAVGLRWRRQPVPHRSCGQSGEALHRDRGTSTRNHLQDAVAFPSPRHGSLAQRPCSVKSWQRSHLPQQLRLRRRVSEEQSCQPHNPGGWQ